MRLLLSLLSCFVCLVFVGCETTYDPDGTKHVRFDAEAVETGFNTGLSAWERAQALRYRQLNQLNRYPDRPVQYDQTIEQPINPPGAPFPVAPSY